VDERTLVLDPESVAAAISRQTRAVIAVHLAGMACPLDELRDLCDSRGVALIEDCSQAYWAEHDGRLVGTVGDLACFSLQQSKHMTCGEGGLVATRNPAYARRAALFADKAWPRFRVARLPLLFLSELPAERAAGRGRARPVGQSGCQRAAPRAAQLDGLSRHPRHRALRPGRCTLVALHGGGGPARTQRFGDALAAEGVPCWVRYIIDPLYMSPVFQGPATYGSSGYPLREHARQSYARGLCPSAEAALSRSIAILWNENYTAEHVGQIGAAVRKVAAAIP
jgi:dTDP-4-amino-4,6-dideoxygalactose transaminase